MVSLASGCGARVMGPWGMVAPVWYASALTCRRAEPPAGTVTEIAGTEYREDAAAVFVARPCPNGPISVVASRARNMSTPVWVLEMRSLGVVKAIILPFIRAKVACKVYYPQPWIARFLPAGYCRIVIFVYDIITLRCP